jgi:hypothetical protein
MEGTPSLLQTIDYVVVLKKASYRLGTNLDFYEHVQSLASPRSGTATLKA